MRVAAVGGAIACGLLFGGVAGIGQAGAAPSEDGPGRGSHESGPRTETSGSAPTDRSFGGVKDRYSRKSRTERESSVPGPKSAGIGTRSSRDDAESGASVRRELPQRPRFQHRSDASAGKHASRSDVGTDNDGDGALGRRPGRHWHPHHPHPHPNHGSGHGCGGHEPNEPEEPEVPYDDGSGGGGAGGAQWPTGPYSSLPASDSGSSTLPRQLPDLPAPPVAPVVVPPAPVIPMVIGPGPGPSSSGGSTAPAAPLTPTVKAAPAPASVTAPQRPVGPVGDSVVPTSYRAGYPEYLREAAVAEIAGVALPGAAGLMALTALGGLVGYRQAKAGLAVRAAGTARFLR